MSATIPQKRQHPLQHRACTAKKPRAESTSEEDDYTEKPPKNSRTARKSRMVESSESSETERDSDEDEVLDFMHQDRCLVPLKGRASMSSDSRAVSTTVISPSPFLGAPFTFTLPPYAVPATAAAVHTLSTVVEPAPTPVDAPPADALAIPAGTVAYTPTITLSSTAEPVPGLSPFQELPESAKGGQTCLKVQLRNPKKTATGLDL
ncbi:hypothetical protein M405DRAFT_870171 [Rhizopogon salebrosus TDB-379]|nr:hypothetical protein M405DRAFT_870474 [Rhizopogon salebrosus TDB-379]KAJ8579551.1 hypothetical protein M405DRAFT_870171 [Rhizopogon salebrosus TDB-379]